MTVLKTIRRAGRFLLESLVGLIYRGPEGGTIDPSQIRKILVVRVDTRVGDVLLTTPLVRALRKSFPNARIHWLIASGKECLVEGLCDELVSFRKKDFFQNPLKFWGVIRRLRRERYDVVVEAAHWHVFSFTSSWLASIAGSPIRIGHDRGLAGRFLTHSVEKDPANEREVPSKLELLKPLGALPDGEGMDTTVDAPEKVAPLLAQLDEITGGRGFVAFNPAARKPNRRWSPEGFGRLAATLAQRADVVPLIFWGPGEEDIARRVVEASSGKAVLAPPTNLAELAASFRKSRLTVTNDTGPMHLAVATGTRVLAVLTFQDGPRWTPAKGPLFDSVCVNGVDDVSDESVAQVESAALKLLS